MTNCNAVSAGLTARLLFCILLSALALTPEVRGANVFTATGGIGVWRFDHTTTLLPNGKVLVAGGEGGSGGSIFLAELYDPATGTWTATGRQVTGRKEHTATLLPSGKVLVTGGRVSVIDYLNSAELYDPAAGTWTATGSLGNARAKHTATLLHNGKVLVAGGFSGSSLTSSGLYDPATGTWTATGNLVTARHFHKSTLLPNGKILVVGGYNSSNGGNAVTSSELYDPATGMWTATGNLVVARYLHAATLLHSGKVLVAGGYNSINGALTITSSELYDPATGTWTVTGSLVAGRYNHTATLLPNGRVLVAGGWNESYLTSSELYDPATGMWTATGSLGNARANHTSTLLPSGKVLIAGGRNISGNGVFGSAELYIIDSDLDPFSLPPSMVSPPISLPNGSVQFAYTNVSGLPFSALGSTKIPATLNDWSFVAVGIETAVGQYQFTDPQATSYPQRFYRVTSP